jgi:undecaprenyl phosphate-alpha-L-ara4N flippase subunit ArnF
MGYVFALCSVMLVTLAQLMLRWSMVRLPGIEEIAGQWQQLSLPAVIALCAGLLAYTLSMLCWMLALRRIALSRAYPLLSLSYVLVWLLAIALPHPKVLNRASTIRSCSSIRICSFKTSPHSGAPTIPVPTRGSSRLSDPMFRGWR